jgi:hypothetical protein
MPKTLNIGAYSSGTLLPEDLIPRFVDALTSVDETGAHSELIKAAESIDDYDSDEYEQPDLFDDFVDELVSDLIDALNEYCPPYCYFGAGDGDGACYGVWLSWDSLEELVRVSDPSELDDISADETEVVFVNDHGNVTLYHRTEGGGWAVTWEIV